jgi:plasmid maintenance system antidote protein VapI
MIVSFKDADTGALANGRRAKRAITADTDLRLCRFFGLSNGYWLRAQAAYDTEVADELHANSCQSE